MEQLPSQNICLKAEKITKKFNKNKVLKGASIELPLRAIYGICGFNGSGKSVFLKICSGLMLPDSGTVSIFNKKIGNELEFAPDTGILIDGAGFLASYSAARNLELLAKVSGKGSAARIREVLEQVGLNAADKKPVGTFSTGMKQRLGLAQALMEEPQLLLLDEPTNGLDFAGQREIYTILSELRGSGVSILLTSHSLDEMKILCDKVFEMDRGVLSPFVRPGIGEELEDERQ
jgi:ABC-2 type transport system ATP-binding protein